MKISVGYIGQFEMEIDDKYKPLDTNRNAQWGDIQHKLFAELRPLINNAILQKCNTPFPIFINETTKDYINWVDSIETGNAIYEA